MFDPATGLLTQKLDAASHGVSYSYTPDGKMWTRTWARGVVATYGYDAATGELLSVDYSNDPANTPSLAFTYNRLGQRETVSDAVGTRTFYYRFEDGSLPLEQMDAQLWQEDIVAGTGGLYSKTLTRKYESSGVPGRGIGFQVGTTADPDADYDATYGYDAATGRLNQVAGPGLPVAGVTYDRVAGSELIWKTNFATGPDTNIVRTFEAQRDVLLKVENYCSGSLISRYNYDVGDQTHGADNVGRRTKVVYGGSAFNYGPSPAPPARTEWGYNDRNELASAHTYTAAGQEMTQRYRTYTNDPIGNWKIAQDMRVGGDAGPYYCTNALNQYVTRDDTQGCPPSAPVVETFAYDDDGNMTQDKTYNYTWDAENRLHSVTPRSPVNGSKKLEFVCMITGAGGCRSRPGRTTGARGA